MSINTNRHFPSLLSSLPAALVQDVLFHWISYRRKKRALSLKRVLFEKRTNSAAYSWWRNQIKPQRREQIIISVISTVSNILKSACQIHSIKFKNKQAEKCENEHKGRGVPCLCRNRQIAAMGGELGGDRDRKNGERQKVFCPNSTNEMLHAH